MASWLSKHLGIHLDSHTLGNVLKNVSPALAFTPLGLAGTAAASAIGDLSRGKNIGQAALGAGENVALGAGARTGAGFLRNALNPTANPSVLTGALPGPSSLATQAVDGAPALAGTSAPSAGLPALSTPVPPSGFADKLTSAAKGVGSFIKDNPTAAGQIGSAAGNLVTAGPRNAEATAQTGLLRQQLEQNQYDLARRKASDLALEPIREALYGKLSQNLGYSPATAGGP